MTTVRIGARAAKSLQEVIDWLDHNIGPSISKESIPRGFNYAGKGWVASWKQYGAGWFLDVTFNDPKDAVFFSLRWK